MSLSIDATCFSVASTGKWMAEISISNGRGKRRSNRQMGWTTKILSCVEEIDQKHILMSIVRSHSNGLTCRSNGTVSSMCQLLRGGISHSNTNAQCQKKFGYLRQTS